MTAPENLPAQMLEKTDDELSAIVRNPDDWLPEALNAAKVELRHRGVDVSSVAVGPPPLKEGQPVFFAVSPFKLVVMSIVTFGIYEVFWFYKNWKFVKQRTNRNIMPFWRAFFLPIFCHPFFGEVKDIAESLGIRSGFSPTLLAFLCIVFNVSWIFPHPCWLMGFLIPFVLIPVQNLINRLNDAVAPSHNSNSRFSGLNIAGLVIGGILFTLCIIGLFLAR